MSEAGMYYQNHSVLPVSQGLSVVRNMYDNIITVLQYYSTTWRIAFLSLEFVRLFSDLGRALYKLVYRTRYVSLTWKFLLDLPEFSSKYYQDATRFPAFPCDTYINTDEILKTVRWFHILLMVLPCWHNETFMDFLVLQKSRSRRFQVKIDKRCFWRTL